MKWSNLRLVLWPLGLLFGLVAMLRTKLYTMGVFKRHIPPVATVVIGNLSTGGTGKTPLVLYLAEKWSRKWNIATLSRGYGRKTKGFRWVSPGDDSATCGDEPLLLRQNLPERVQVAVGENRPEGIRRILEERPATNLVLLDDAYQHLALKARFYILTTPYDKPFYADALLPAGNLREPVWAKNRAHAMVVTKCPPTLSHAEAAAIRQRLNPTPGQPVCFTSLAYQAIRSISGPVPMDDRQPFLLVTGIANPGPLEAHLTGKACRFDTAHFADHHAFTPAEVATLAERARQLNPEMPQILTTEKDAVRLAPLLAHRHDLVLAVQPIGLDWLLGTEPLLEKAIWKSLQQSH